MADDLETDAALATLTKEELALLAEEIDPDNCLLPARDRVANQTSKKSTGDFDRDRLLNYMSESAKTSTVGSDYVTFQKKTRGRVYEPTRKPKPQTDEMDEIEKLLLGMSESDLGELADDLEVDGLSTKTRFSSSKRRSGPPTSAVTYSYIPGVGHGPDHDELSMDEILERIQDNDSSLTELNVNNRRIDNETRQQLLRCLRFNTHIEKILLANTKLDDDDARILAVHLETNRTIKVMNLESNRLTGAGVRVILRALQKNNTVQELRLENQYNPLGTRTEMDAAHLLEKNTTLLRLGLSFKGGGARQKVDRILLRNNDAARQRRRLNSQS